MLLCSFAEALRLPSHQVGQEIQTLQAKKGFVITARAEEQFYVSNNLPENLRLLFMPINPRRLDEDLLFERSNRAQKLLLEASLLEDFIGQVYTAFDNSHLPNNLIMRRPSSQNLEPVKTKREVLLGLKRLWARDWGFEAVLARLDKHGKIGLEAGAAYLLGQ
jgi:Pyruvate phosphate dikinase, AMP/ATP-binding domain